MNSKIFYLAHIIMWAIFLLILIFFFHGCIEESEESSIPTCGSFQALDAPFWKGWHDLELIEDDPYLIDNLSSDAYLWKIPVTGELVFEHLYSNGYDWDRVVILSRPTGPCTSSIYFLRGRGGGYSVKGSLDIIEGNLILLRVTERIHPPGEAWEIYRELHYRSKNVRWR